GGAREPAPLRERDRGQPDRQRRARERGEVVDAEEGHLPLPRPLALELADGADELEEAPAARGDAPRDECDQEGVDLPGPAQEQHERRREQRVVDHLGEREEVRRRPLDRTPEARQAEEREQRAGDAPERERPAERAPAEPDAGDGGDEHGHEHGHVRAEDVDRPERRVRLVAAVEEDEREGRRRHEREQVRGARAGVGLQGAPLYSEPPMASRTLRRRAATALGVYGSAVLGFLATVVAARELSKADFARFALAFGTTTLLQLFVDLTIDEVVIKYGNRYAAREAWGRFHRLFRIGLAVKLAGGAAGTAAVAGAALLSP